MESVTAIQPPAWSGTQCTPRWSACVPCVKTRLRGSTRDGLQHEELKLAEPAGVVRTRPKRSHFAGRGGREPDEGQSCAAAKRALRFGDSEVVCAWDKCDDERDGREGLNHQTTYVRRDQASARMIEAVQDLLQSLGRVEDRQQRIEHGQNQRTEDRPAVATASSEESKCRR